MTHAVFVSKDRRTFEEIEQILTAHNIDIITWTGNGKNALDLLPNIDLLITDETLADMDGRTLVETVVTQSPMTNCAAASSLPAKEFHDLFEGLGVLMQLPPKPTWQDGETLISSLKKIMDLSA